MSIDLLPDLDDPVSGPFWRGLRDRRILIQHCGTCGAPRWEPASVCPECLAPEGDLRDVTGTGSLWSFTVYHRALNPGLRDEIPYAVGLIELDAGVRMLGRLAGPLESLQIGASVEAVFCPLTPDVTRLDWRVA